MLHDIAGYLRFATRRRQNQRTPPHHDICDINAFCMRRHDSRRNATATPPAKWGTLLETIFAYAVKKHSATIFYAAAGRART